MWGHYAGLGKEECHPNGQVADEFHRRDASRLLTAMNVYFKGIRTESHCKVQRTLSILKDVYISIQRCKGRKLSKIVML